MQPWINEVLDRVAADVVCGYHTGQSPASEPTALAVLALLAHGRTTEAKAGLNFLAEAQGQDGGVAIRREETLPQWPTGLAILAWQAADPRHYHDRIRRAMDWLLSLRGETMPRTPDLGHDTTLSAWPWVAGTHSWVEPTSLAVLALKATGKGDHPRTREAVRLLIDRLIPGGGCNYGNTFCLGQKLRPHLQPSGMALLALAGEPGSERKIAPTIAWLSRSLSAESPTVSLGWGLWGLSAHDAAPNEAAMWLQTAWRRGESNDRSPYKRALVALAAGKLRIAS